MNHLLSAEYGSSSEGEEDQQRPLVGKGQFASGSSTTKAPPNKRVRIELAISGNRSSSVTDYATGLTKLEVERRQLLGNANKTESVIGGHVTRGISSFLPVPKVSSISKSSVVSTKKESLFDFIPTAVQNKPTASPESPSIDKKTLKGEDAMPNNATLVESHEEEAIDPDEFFSLPGGIQPPLHDDLPMGPEFHPSAYPSTNASSYYHQPRPYVPETEESYPLFDHVNQSALPHIYSNPREEGLGPLDPTAINLLGLRKKDFSHIVLKPVTGFAKTEEEANADEEDEDNMKHVLLLPSATGRYANIHTLAADAQRRADILTNQNASKKTAQRESRKKYGF